MAGKTKKTIEKVNIVFPFPADWPPLHGEWEAKPGKTLCSKVIKGEWYYDEDCGIADVECKTCLAIITRALRDGRRVVSGHSSPDIEHFRKYRNAIASATGDGN